MIWLSYALHHWPQQTRGLFIGLLMKLLFRVLGRDTLGRKERVALFVGGARGGIVIRIERDCIPTQSFKIACSIVAVCHYKYGGGSCWCLT